MKFKKFSLFILVLLVMLMPVSAFDWDTHEYVAEKTCEEFNCHYSELVRSCSVLPDKMKEVYGSEESDKHFCFSFYCPAKRATKVWLEKAKFENDEMKKWCYIGIASHYFADSRAPTHQSVFRVKVKCHGESETLVGEFVKNSTQSWNANMCGINFSDVDLHELIFDYKIIVKETVF